MYLLLEHETQIQEQERMESQTAKLIETRGSRKAEYESLLKKTKELEVDIAERKQGKSIYYMTVLKNGL